MVACAGCVGECETPRGGADECSEVVAACGENVWGPGLLYPERLGPRTGVGTRALV